MLIHLFKFSTALIRFSLLTSSHIDFPNCSSSTAVRVHNSGSTARLVSVETSGASLIGTFTLGAGATEIISKDPTDEVFAAHAEVLGVGVGIIG